MSKLNFTDEEFHQMDFEDYFNVEIKPNLFAVSRIFAEANKQMTLAEYKTFTLALSKINWKDKCPDTLYLDKKELAKVLNINSDIDHLSRDLFRAIGDMPKHSFIKFNDHDKKFYASGNFVRTIVVSFRNVVRIRLEEDFLGLFGELDGKEEVSKYITMWSGDIYQMKSERAVQFYELLRENSDTRILQNTGTVSIKKFKELFGIPKDGKGSYMTSDGHFKRTHFEQYVIDPVCEELSKTRMIQLIVQPDGKYYEKVKKGNRVIAYKFYWSITQFPKIVTALEDREIQQKQINDPEIMNVAKSIVNGKKSPKKAKKGKKPNYTERNYSDKQMDDLEERFSKN